ncbi:MAG TPA: transposase [Candidatus Acidoferrales bacterium]|nr:transposase [Candidatus Acidoferrales bacterium]
MDEREQRGQVIATTKKLRRKGDLWIVPSQGSGGTYVVDPTEQHGATCSCPDFETRREKCKHVFAVEFTIQRETVGADGSSVTEAFRFTYRQEWPAYNAAQTHEKEHVAAFLHGLCAAIDNPPQQGRGRPRLPLSDAVFCAVMKVYGGTSGRRASVDMRDYATKGYIDKAPHYNSIFNILESPALTPILKTMIEESARPLRLVESDFAVDSSGFSTTVYARWFDHKYGREKVANEWVKAHIMIGVKTNVVTSAEVTAAYQHDYAHLQPLLARTTKSFNVAAVSADKAYLGHDNLDAIVGAGAFPLIPFKSNSTRYGMNSHSKESRALWRRMHDFFTHNREEFLQHYHKRSNVETTFHMIKSKFGSRVRSKTPVAQTNEVLCKVLCHNLCCLVSAFYELGIEATFWGVAS